MKLDHLEMIGVDGDNNPFHLYSESPADVHVEYVMGDRIEESTVQMTIKFEQGYNITQNIYPPGTDLEFLSEMEGEEDYDEFDEDDED